MSTIKQPDLRVCDVCEASSTKDSFIVAKIKYVNVRPLDAFEGIVKELCKECDTKIYAVIHSSIEGVE